MDKKSVFGSIAVGDIVTDKYLNCLFKVVAINYPMAYGFDLLNDCSAIEIHMDILIKVYADTPLLKVLCGNEGVRVTVATLLNDTIEKQANYLSFSPRNFARLINEYLRK